jgi:succinate dehydrogenase / fumarate reductase, flavoprotein subunit
MSNAMTPATAATAVLIIGAGAAGLRTAIELRRSGVDCLVLGKRGHGDAHTRWAAGGINASLGTRDPDDTWEQHAADTIREGHWVCDPQAVELLCREAPDRVRELHAWGCDFSETDDGGIDQRYFGAQSFRRTCFVGDRTGEAILETLVDRARAAGVPHREHVFVTGIVVDDGRATGAVAIDLETGRRIVFRAHAVVLAAGGCTSAWDRSTSRRDENNGDAVALAFNAGAVLRDMEFVQFHPTGIIRPHDLRGRLVTEAVRGEGGRLFNAAGERFMERHSPEHMELDARDVVARAIYREIMDGRGTDDGAVLLDISHRDEAFIRERLPQIADTFAAHGIDITREPMEVAPTAHYSMGGVRVDFATGATALPGLYAVGEATAGVHGANRLGGNSLAETVVFGRITGAHLAGQLAGRGTAAAGGGAAGSEAAVAAQLALVDRLETATGPHDPAELAAELGVLLWRHGGIVRSAEKLREGLELLDTLERRAGDVTSGPAGSTGFVQALNLHFMLRTARLVLRGALLREESRGAHYREDMPDSAADGEHTILFRRTADGGVHSWTEPIPPLRPGLEHLARQAGGTDYHHLE